MPELLKHERFILFSPDMASGAYEATLTLCIHHGFRPNVQREAAQWTSLATMIGSGLGLPIAPASVARMHIPGVCCVPLASQHRTKVQMVFRDGSGNPSGKKLLEFARSYIYNQE